MNVPENLKYSSDHEWVRVEGNVAFIGVTDYAQSQLGDIVFVDVQTEGETLDKGDMFGAIEAVKTVADSFVPVSGKVLEVNPALESNPQLVNQDPYGEGWLIKVEIAEPAQLNDLLSAEDYKGII
ncbi:MAG: glycine cleavage system protein GcvH [Bacteroidales bacterium]|nr:glycine cleavage system protein GcvH [Bacteroidales bacterium]MCL2133620.1 glycine cleavage system protein GcvH [Bacteroidales bacterium]